MALRLLTIYIILSELFSDLPQAKNTLKISIFRETTQTFLSPPQKSPNTIYINGSRLMMDLEAGSFKRSDLCKNENDMQWEWETFHGFDSIMMRRIIFTKKNG